MAGHFDMNSQSEMIKEFENSLIEANRNECQQNDTDNKLLLTTHKNKNKIMNVIENKLEK